MRMRTGDVARFLGVTTSAVYSAIKKKKLKAFQDDTNHWYIKFEDVKAYEENRYGRHTSLKEDGSHVYGKGIINVNKAAELLNVQRMVIYYLIYKKVLPCKRHGKMYLLKEEDVLKLPRKRNEKFYSPKVE